MQHYALKRSNPERKGNYSELTGPFRTFSGAIHYLHNSGQGPQGWDVVKAKKQRKRK